MERVRLSSQQSLVLKLGDTQMTLSPKFRLAVIQSSLLNPSPEFELSLQTEPLILGLPDDVAWNCLLRLHVGSHLAVAPSASIDICCSVVKIGKIQWQVLVSLTYLGTLFRLCLVKTRFALMDLGVFQYPNMECSLYVGGMVSDVDCQLDLVLKYEIQKNRWTVMNRMNVARSFFGSGVVDGVVYVAGGNSTDLYELDSAEAFDPLKGNWHKIASMGTNMATYDATVVDGKLLVTEGWLWPFFVSPRGQVYDPKTGKWENMVVGLREGWTWSSVVVYGRLF
ncbi:F-box/kelch-repeat protein At1g30090 [Linum perenne]